MATSTSLFLFILLCFVPIQGGPNCPWGWIPRFNSCYKFTRDALVKSWIDARIRCQSMGGDLVDINTAAERDYVIQTVGSIMKYMAKKHAKVQYHNWWIGLNAMGDGKTWQSANGSNTNTAILSSVFQAGHNRPNSKVQCVQINSRQLYVDSCMKGYQSICESPQNLPLTCDNDNGWQLYSGMCYKRFGGVETFADASQICRKSSGATLPVIPDDDTQRVLSDFAKNYKGSIWTGVKAEKKGKAYTWRYSNGTLVSKWNKFYWYPKQPGNRPKTNVNDTCVQLTQQGKFNSSWIASSCKSKKIVICQRPEGVCPDGWLQYGQTCYQFYPDVQTFYQANSYCNKIGGNLFRPISKYVQGFINGNLLSQRKSGIQSVWIGVRDDINKNVWRYVVSGKLNNYTNWIKNGGRHTVNKTTCVFMGTGNPRGYWFTTTYCNQPKSFICEIPSNKPLKQIPVPDYVYNCGRNKKWKNFGKNCFYFSAEGARPFEIARTWCTGVSANLVVIPDQDTQNFIEESIDKKGAYWIGLQDQDRENVFTWLDGITDLNYTNWKKGQPNNYAGGENCAMIYGTGNTKGQWNDDSCSKSYYFICERTAQYVKNVVPKTTPKPFGVKCGPFWEEVPNSDYCYMFSDKQRIWADARSICKSIGGDLLSITSSVEQAYVTGRISGMQSTTLWIGANDMKSEGGYGWTDKSPFSYMNWFAGEPNNAHNREDCVCMYTKNGMWNDNRCIARQGFACKKLGQTNSTTTAPTTSPATVASGMTWGCPDLWKGYKGSCYLYIPDLLPQPDALSNCRVQSAELASIPGRSENKYIQSLIPSKKNTIAWIGLNDVRSESEFEWTDGNPVTYTNWASGDPNNLGGNQDCVGLLSSSGGWIDLKCADARPSVCRKPKSAVLKQVVIDGCEKFPGSLGYRGSCYLFVSKPRNWYRAEGFCRSKKGHLATVYDNHVQAYLAAEITLQGDHYWIGLNDYKSPGVYKWSSRQQVSYTAWSDTHTGNERKTCTVMNALRPIGLWSSTNCTENHGFICDYPRSGFTNPPITVTTQSNLPCPNGWTGYRGMCYKAYVSDKSNQKTFTEARDTCTSVGGDLVSIHNASLEDFFSKTILSNQTGVFWIGLNDRDTEKSHGWTDGTPFDYANWAKKEPNDWNHQEDCVQYDVDSNSWYDDNCYLAHNFICQLQKGLTISTTPTPGTAVTSTYECHNSTWLYYDHYCYYLSPTSGPNAKLNFFDAEAFCNANAAHLASIHSAEENGFLTSVMNKHSTVMFYIGLNDLDLAGYQWPDGTPVNYVDWSPNEPNDAFGGERCTQIQSNRGTWTDVTCGLTNGYVCKKKGTDTVPITPPPIVLQQGGCPPNFVEAKGSSKCYYLAATVDAKIRLNYTAARAACQSMGTGVDIASINSYIEQLTINTLMRGLPVASWIGLNDMRRNGLFMWQDNSQVTYTNWGKHEPNENLKNKHDRQDCVLVIPKGKSPGGFWVDAQCAMKKSYICQTLRNPSLPSVGPNTSGCSNGYQRFAGSCYSLKTTKRNWADAQTQCQLEGANLVSIADVYEQSFVSLLVFENNAYVWTGLNDKQKAGTYRWIVNSDRVSYTNWGYNEPSKKDGEGCVAMRVNNKWDDSLCNKTFTYVCEIVVNSQVLTTPTTVGTCQKKWTPFNGRCFRDFSNRNVSWSSANTRCKRARSDLVSIHNADEDNFISSLITNSANDIWLGIQRAQNGGYQNSDGTPTNYMNWDVNEPTDGSNTMRQNCVARVAASQRWNDLTCNFKKGYICVKPMALKTPAPNIIPITPKRQTPAPVTKKQNIPRTLFPNNLTPKVTPVPVKQTTIKAATQGNVPTNAPMTPVVTPAPTQFTRGYNPITQAQRNPNTNDSGGLSDGGVAGIVIAVLLIVLVGMFAFGFMAKRNKWTFASVRGAIGFENALYNHDDQTLTIQSDA
ncbi:hypothetical protein SNE40_008704 [Patella caerulea]|uniref:C-type lectin domain-containing protein n=1 Tax=Patella caerulea TaxID=87958 RepID=A0AAN8PR27_PATCE